MMTIILDGQQMTVVPSILWTSLALTIAITIGFYLLRSFGLYKMAKNKGYEKAFLVFIPCAWVYVACKIIGDSKFFSTTFEKLAVLFLIIFTISEVVGFAYSFINYFPIVGNFFKEGAELFMVFVSDPMVPVETYTEGMTHISGDIYGIGVANPYLNMGISTKTVNTVLNILYYFSSLFSLASFVITLLIFINIFKTYIPQHYILYAVLSVLLGIFAPLVFAVRNKPAVNYNDYLRSRYSAWYANSNPYGGPVNNGAPQAPQAPFEEFAEKGEVDPGDPFDHSSNSTNGNVNNNTKTNSDDDEFFD